MRSGFNPTKYQDSHILKDLVRGRKFRLDCGHYATVGHHSGLNIVIINTSKNNDGENLEVVCTGCYQ